MKKILLFTLLLTAAAAAAQPSEAPWIVAPTEKGTATQRILFIGDSVTDGGWGNSAGSAKASAERNHWDQNHLYGHSYMMLCAAQLLAAAPEAERIFYNRGISGDDLARLEARWEEDAIALQPDLLSLLIGTNDVHYHLQLHPEEPFDFADWEQRYRSLLDRARSARPDLVLFLGTPFVARSGKAGAAADYPQREALVRQLAGIVVRIAADYGAILLRYNRIFDELPTQHPTVAMSHWIWDGIHPTAAGHRLMANLWLARFGELEAAYEKR